MSTLPSEDALRADQLVLFIDNEGRNSEISIRVISAMMTGLEHFADSYFAEVGIVRVKSFRRGSVVIEAVAILSGVAGLAAFADKYATGFIQFGSALNALARRTVSQGAASFTILTKDRSRHVPAAEILGPDPFMLDSSELDEGDALSGDEPETLVRPGLLEINASDIVATGYFELDPNDELEPDPTVYFWVDGGEQIFRTVHTQDQPNSVIQFGDHCLIRARRIKQGKTDALAVLDIIEID